MSTYAERLLVAAAKLKQIQFNYAMRARGLDPSHNYHKKKYLNNRKKELQGRADYAREQSRQDAKTKWKDNEWLELRSGDSLGSALLRKELEKKRLAAIRSGAYYPGKILKRRNTYAEGMAERKAIAMAKLQKLKNFRRGRVLNSNVNFKRGIAVKDYKERPPLSEEQKQANWRRWLGTKEATDYYGERAIFWMNKR